jgi:hypothetical protein
MNSLGQSHPYISTARTYSKRICICSVHPQAVCILWLRVHTSLAMRLHVADLKMLSPLLRSWQLTPVALEYKIHHVTPIIFNTRSSQPNPILLSTSRASKRGAALPIRFFYALFYLCYLVCNITIQNETNPNLNRTIRHRFNFQRSTITTTL